jgi:hypothetical protein
VGQDKKDVKRNAASQEEMGGAQAGVGAEQEAFYKFLKDQGIEDRETQESLFQELAPFARTLIQTYNPGEYADIARPERPDISGAYKRSYQDEMANIQDAQNMSVADMADFYQGQGLTRSGAQGLGYGSVARGSDSERTGARARLNDNLTGEKLAGYEDAKGAYYDALNKRGLDVNTALAGSNILTGQQQQFNPNTSFGMAGGNLSGAGGTYGGAGGTYGGAAGTNLQASRMPGTWSKVGGAIQAGIGIAAPFLPGGQFAGAFTRRPAPTG